MMTKQHTALEERGTHQLSLCQQIIYNYLTYPSPSFKHKVLIAALYAESIFEMNGRWPVSSIFHKYTDPSYPVYVSIYVLQKHSFMNRKVRCEAYRCLTRILRMEKEKVEWFSSFLSIFDQVMMDPHPSVPVAFLDYLINPEPMSPYMPIAEHYLNTARISRPEICSAVDQGRACMTVAESIWQVLGSRSRFNPRLRKLLFILYKYFFGLRTPDVYTPELRETLKLVEMNFEDTPLDLYATMVSKK